MSPVWMMNDGLIVIAFTFATASRSVAQRIGICGLVEADMAVAHLQEAEAGLGRSFGFAEQAACNGDAAAHGPEHAGPGPHHAFEGVTAIKADIIVVVWFSGHDKISIADGLRLEENSGCAGFIPGIRH